MKKIQQGFTLVELMIVVAIIGVLAAIAIPQYQDYVAKTQVTAGLAEIAGAKAAYEVLVNQESPAADFTESNVGLTTSTARCTTIGVNFHAAGVATPALSCTLAGNPKIATAVVQLNRDADGRWTCVIGSKPGDWKSMYLPTGCT